ncbi:hypothetical protein DEU56DRAFT_755893 [Suillus clintonianus]|uniref:uncharacterized protein n=1 Tax=Suillus clintonianus TaxID=1904413 RepID=UPI001B8669C3|nr:uncharacterized protein DEU56DRAFT_755893 [Suillus clintonianus]KAG2138327.1 hypothetical protein DEU56DRAFT_755893 [Suillus clintonianus]
MSRSSPCLVLLTPALRSPLPAPPSSTLLPGSPIASTRGIPNYPDETALFATRWNVIVAAVNAVSATGVAPAQLRSFMSHELPYATASRKRPSCLLGHAGGADYQSGRYLAVKIDITSMHHLYHLQDGYGRAQTQKFSPARQQKQPGSKLQCYRVLTFTLRTRTPATAPGPRHSHGGSVPDLADTMMHLVHSMTEAEGAEGAYAATHAEDEERAPGLPTEYDLVVLCKKHQIYCPRKSYDLVE